MFPRILFAILLIISGLAVAGTPMEDFDAAQQLAKREKKDVLLSFPGVGPWWPTEGFYTETDDPWITEHFVLFEVPLNASASGEKATPVDRELVELRKWYHQDLDDPSDTFFLLDPSGRPYAELSVEEQPPDAYIPVLNEAQLRRANRDAAFEQACQAKGLKKARLLNKGLLAFDAGPVWNYDFLVDQYYQDVLAELISNDPKDVLSQAEELEERKEFAKEMGATESLKKLASDLNRVLEEGSDHAAVSTAIDQYLLRHPDFSVFNRQIVLAGKIEAAVILRDYAAAQKALDEVVSAFPDTELSKNLKSNILPEIEDARKRLAAGIDKAATIYAIRLDSFGGGLLDADGIETMEALKGLDHPPDNMLGRDSIDVEFSKVDLHLRLRNYKEALNALDRFVGYGAGSGRARHEDRELRPIILRGLNKKHPNEGKSPRDG